MSEAGVGQWSKAWIDGVLVQKTEVFVEVTLPSSAHHGNKACEQQRDRDSVDHKEDGEVETGEESERSTSLLSSKLVGGCAMLGSKSES